MGIIIFFAVFITIVANLWLTDVTCIQKFGKKAEETLGLHEKNCYEII